MPEKKKAQSGEKVYSVKLFVIKEATVFFLYYYSFYYHFLPPKSDSARAHATFGWLSKTGRQICEQNCGQNTISLAEKTLQQVRSDRSKILLQCSFLTHETFEINDPSSMWKACHILTT